MRVGVPCAGLLCLQAGTDPRATTTVLADLLFNILRSFLGLSGGYEAPCCPLDPTSPIASGKHVRYGANLFSSKVVSTLLILIYIVLALASSLCHLCLKMPGATRPFCVTSLRGNTRLWCVSLFRCIPKTLPLHPLLLMHQKNTYGF